MALYFSSSNPAGLQKKFEEAVALGNKKDGIATWRKHKQSNHFTHTGPQFADGAWFHPKAEQGRLAFYLKFEQGKKFDPMLYAYYHGHLIETMIHHFDSHFTLASATPNAVDGDSSKKA